jgi:sRNA-binding regulator protein Hfq
MHGMFRACRLFLVLFLCATFLYARDQPAMEMLWPAQDNATLKLTFGQFHSVDSSSGKLTLASDVIVQNLTSTVMPQASLSVFLLDKDHVRIGSGLLVVNDLNPGESVKVLFECEAMGAPVTISIGARNTGGVPTSLKTIPLQVISVPSGASVKVDGKDHGVTPTTVSLSIGTHNLELEKEGYGPTSTPVEIAATDLPNGSIKITLSGLPNDEVFLRDGTRLTGDVMSMDLDSILIRVDGKDQKIERNEVSKMFLVERILTHVQSPTASTTTKPAGSAIQTPHR